MSYSILLRKIMVEANITQKQLLEELTKLGMKRDKAYLSRLMNGKESPPSEELSRNISRICGVDERLLVIEGYIDKAPKEIIDMLKSVKFMGTIASMNFLNLYDKSFLKSIEKEIDKEINKNPLSDIVVTLIDDKEKFSNFINEDFFYEKLNEENSFSITLKSPQGIDITDDSMLPLIQKGDKVLFSIENNYRSNDILLLKYQDSIMARYVYKINNTLKLVACNRKYNEIICTPDEVIILGRISEIMRKI